MSDQGHMERLNAALEGRYRVERQLGEGGMATVYLAHDLRHDRQVAIKVLHQDLAVALGAERFLTEIKTTARLQHPHVLPLLDSGSADGLLYYVMPLVAGESLRDRLTREKQLPIEDAIQIAREVADALGHAHGQGVIHRDVKPENILLQEGHARVADFGIALAVQAAGGARMTQTGLSLGTPQYMSPEQAMGEKALDARADIYALGAVTYEMLTGEPPFTGATVHAIVAKVMSAEPERPTVIRKTIPGRVEAAVLKALAKLPADRWTTAHDFALALNAEASVAPTSAFAGPRHHTPRPWSQDPRTIALGGALAFLLVALGWSVFGTVATDTPAVDAGPVRFTMNVPAGAPLRSTWPEFAISPDGRAFAFVSGGDTARVFLRRAESFDFEPIASVAYLQPAIAFAPDGRAVALASGSEILRLPLSGGVPVPVGTVPVFVGGLEWISSDTILASGASGGLWAMSVRTGRATPLTIPDTTRGETAHLPPVARLPSGQWAFSSRSVNGDHIAVMAPDMSEWFWLPDVQGLLRGAVGEHLLIERGSGTVAVAIASDGSMSGTAVPVEPAGSRLWASASGTVISVDAATKTFALVDGRGTMTRLPIRSGAWRWPRLSPDGHQVVAGEPDGLFVVDVVTGQDRRLGPGGEAIWSPDGVTLAHWVVDAGRYRLVTQGSDGNTRPASLSTSERDLNATSWSPDGGFLLIASGDPAAGGLYDVVVRDSTGSLRVLIGGPGNQRAPMFSPNGSWIAYSSDEGGAFEVFLTNWPAADRRWSVSTAGGSDPVWSRDGRELYYLSGERVMAVDVAEGAGGEPVISGPRVRYSGPFLVDPFGDQSYDVAPDGQLLLLFRSDETPERIRVTLGWQPPTEATSR